MGKDYHVKCPHVMKTDLVSVLLELVTVSLAEHILTATNSRVVQKRILLLVTLVYVSATLTVKLLNVKCPHVMKMDRVTVGVVGVNVIMAEHFLTVKNLRAV
jgi:hypothetical protein